MQLRKVQFIDGYTYKNVAKNERMRQLILQFCAENLGKFKGINKTIDWDRNYGNGNI